MRERGKSWKTERQIYKERRIHKEKVNLRERGKSWKTERQIYKERRIHKEKVNLRERGVEVRRLRDRLTKREEYIKRRYI